MGDFGVKKNQADFTEIGTTCPFLSPFWSYIFRRRIVAQPNGLISAKKHLEFLCSYIRFSYESWQA